MNRNFSEYVVRNYIRFVNDSNINISNSMALLDRMERNLNRMARSMLDDQEFRRTEQLLNRYNDLSED